MSRAWNLVADIGGTNARLFLVCPRSGTRLRKERLCVDAYDGIGAVAGNAALTGAVNCLRARR